MIPENEQRRQILHSQCVIRIILGKMSMKFDCW